MDLDEQLNRLMLLQSTEDDIARLEKDRDNLKKDIDQQKKNVEVLEKEFEDIHQEKISKQKIADSLEVRIKSKENENERLKIQLNTIRNQKNYDAVLQNIKSNEADASKWEDEELNMLEKVDNMRQREAELQSRIAKEKIVLEEIKIRVKHSRDNCSAEIEELTRKKEALRQQIPSEIQSKFDQISKSNNKHALVKVKNRICGGCFTRVPKQIENELMRRDRPVFCHSCGRLLMLEEG